MHLSYRNQDFSSEKFINLQTEKWKIVGINGFNWTYKLFPIFTGEACHNQGSKVSCRLSLLISYISENCVFRKFLPVTEENS